MPPDSIVYVLDFSYPRNTVIELWKNHSLTLLDHHKTAQESLTGLPGCLVDLSKSGAALSWQHFHPDQKMPDLLAYVQDRDLWKFELPNSREISLHLLQGLQLSNMVRNAPHSGNPPARGQGS